MARTWKPLIILHIFCRFVKESFFHMSAASAWKTNRTQTQWLTGFTRNFPKCWEKQNQREIFWCFHFGGCKKVQIRNKNERRNKQYLRGIFVSIGCCCTVLRRTRKNSSNCSEMPFSRFLCRSRFVTMNPPPSDPEWFLELVPEGFLPCQACGAGTEGRTGWQRRRRPGPKRRSSDIRSVRRRKTTWDVFSFRSCSNDQSGFKDTSLKDESLCLMQPELWKKNMFQTWERSNRL